jgi:hypothetical protein
MKNEQWKIGIILSPRGFEGVQFIHATPGTQKKLLTLLPQLHKLIQELGKIVKRQTGGKKHE